MTDKTPKRLSKRLKNGRVSDKAAHNRLMPSPNPATNLLIADIVVRGASSLFRKTVEKRVARASLEDEDEADRLLDGKTVMTTLGLYGLSKLATRSPAGLGMVAGGLALKTLYDRGKARKRRKALKQAGQGRIAGQDRATRP